MKPLLSCARLDVARGGRRLVEGLDFALEPGEIVALVGPNGSGKSSLLATLAGLLAPTAGQILLEGRTLDAWSRHQIARRIGFLPQEIDDPYPATVLETALIGRHPHIGFWRWESAPDIAKTRAALRRVGLADAASRSVATLSGGERRRLAIAAIFAQAPRVYLLDEPLDMLDLAYQARLLGLLERLTRRTRVSIVISLHDLTLTARHARRVVLLDGHGQADIGPPRTVLNASRLSAVYRCQIRIVEAEGLSFYQVG